MVKFRDIYMSAFEDTKDYYIMKAKSKTEKQRSLK